VHQVNKPNGGKKKKGTKKSKQMPLKPPKERGQREKDIHQYN
jgi:hypothetical protein